MGKHSARGSHLQGCAFLGLHRQPPLFPGEVGLHPAELLQGLGTALDGLVVLGIRNLLPRPASALHEPCFWEGPVTEMEERRIVASREQSLQNLDGNL